MNPFVAALYDNLPFCSGGCGACIAELRSRIRTYSGINPPEEWQILASLQPSELVEAPHWEQRVRHLLKKSDMLSHPDRDIEKVIRQWLETSRHLEMNQEHLLFIDFLVWDICHKLRALYDIDANIYQEVVERCTQVAAKAAKDLFGQPGFDSLVESLLIIRNTDALYHDKLAGLLKLPWPDGSRTARVLRESLA